MERKYIVITGGVLSGLGKGIALASIGNLLCSEYKVVPIKCDGYLNVDPGTMNPVEHGEVFVLDDGGEVDMDFGHYERFLDVTCKSDWNLTMGKVFDEIRKRERRGDYLGKTVQYIPHVTDFIREHIFEVSERENSDITLVEIGGTVGDIENELFLEAVRQMGEEIGKDNIMYVHVTYVPIPFGVNEQKSKPTQQSVNLLRQRGILPDMVIARASQILGESIKEKISRFGGVSKDYVVTGLDVSDLYEIPLVFEEQGMSQLLARKLNIFVQPEISKLKKLVEQRRNPQNGELTIAIAGKYTRLEDSYASIIEALHHCAAHFSTKINLKWIETSKDEINLQGIDGVIVPGGFGSRGTEGKISVAKYCREKEVPFLGLCYGLHMAVIDFARNVCGLEGANSTEIDNNCEHPVIDFLDEQKEIAEKGGTMRLGAWPAVIKEGSLVHSLYGSLEVSERHRHRYEVNPKYHKILEENGLVFSGMSPDGKLVEFIELPREKHPYFVATQAHPELKSSLFKPAPLFMGFVEAGLKKKYGGD
ncbi:MAG: CTP synthase (glutamine hydrolyzing) [archaeon]